MPQAAFVLLASVSTAGALFCGCSMVLPHVGELRVEPIGSVIYTYPVPAVIVTNFTLPSSSGVRLRAPNVYPRFQPVAVPAQQLQVGVGYLSSVERRAPVCAQGVVVVSLWNDAIELEILRRAARDARVAERRAQSGERLPSPNLHASTH